MKQQMSSLFDLTDRTVCVIGGGGYLASPACIALAEHGAHVVVADLRHQAAAEVVTQIEANGGSGEAVELDVANEAAVISELDGIVERRDSLDGLVNATFAYRNVPFEQMSLDDWRDGMRISLDAAFILAREAGRIMKAQGRGSIVQFTSMYGEVAPDPSMYHNTDPNPVHYGVAKAGIRQLVRYQASIIGCDGVRINAVMPVPFPNPTVQQADPQFIKRLNRKTMLNRIGSQHEIAGAVVFLIADASSYVTGTQIVIDGGWTAW